MRCIVAALIIIAASLSTALAQEALDWKSSEAHRRELDRLREIEEHYEHAVGLLVFGGAIVWNENGARQVIEVPISTATGFIISPDGHILTNQHVVAEMQEVRPIQDEIAQMLSRRLGQPVAVNYDLLFYIGGKYLFVEMVSSNPKKDFAVLKIKGSQHQEVTWNYFDLKGQMPLPSEELVRGNVVYALGYPAISNYSFTDAQAFERITRQELGRTITEQFNKEDFVLTLTSGCISRVVEDSEGFRFFQHDAIITVGNSGGPLINAEGRVLGINTATSAVAEGYGIAVAVDEIYPEVEKVLGNGRQ